MLLSSLSEALPAIVAPSPRAASNVTGPFSRADSHVTVVGRRASCDRAVESVTFAMRGGASVVVDVDGVAGVALLPSDDDDIPQGEPVLLIQGCVTEGSTGADSAHMSATGARAVRFVFKNVDLEPVEVVLAEVAAVTLAKRKEPHAKRANFASLRGAALAALAVVVLVAFSYLGTENTANDTLGNDNTAVGNRELGANLFATGDTCTCTLSGMSCVEPTTCAGADSCLGAEGEISGGHSCTESDSCSDAHNLKITGGHACTGVRSCSDSNSLTISGAGSCSGERSCYLASGSTIGQDSCTGYLSCLYVSDSTVGHRSCTGAVSCEWADQISIGNFACTDDIGCRYSEVNIPDNCRSRQDLDCGNCNKWWNHLAAGCFNSIKASPMTNSTPASCAESCDESRDCKGIQVDLNANTCGEVRAKDLAGRRGRPTSCPEKLLYLKSP